MMKRYRHLILILILAVGIAQQGYARMRSFDQLSKSPSADLQNTILEIVYVGPTDKLFPVVVLSGGVNALAAHDALQAALKNAIPPAGERLVFVVSTQQLSRVLESIRVFKGTKTGAVVGLYAIGMTARDTASVLLDRTEGRQALKVISDEVTDPDARRAILKLTRMIFPH